MFAAFNNTKKAYLCLDRMHHWSLTCNPHTAFCTTKEKLMSITATQVKMMPDDWEYQQVENGVSVSGQKEAEPVESINVLKPVVISGEWKATQAYNEILDAVQKLSSVVSKTRACELAAEVSRCNAEVIDMEHFIEFNELDEVQGYEAYRKLRTLLQRRRDVKQQLELTNRILDSGVRQLTDGHTFEPAQDTVTKNYYPRGDGTIFAASTTNES